MAQDRLFEFEAPDSTFDLNKRFGVIAPSGRYAGFDAVLDNTLNLQINHLVTGKIFVQLGGDDSDPFGIVVTKQGVLIAISDNFVLPISSTGINPRTDAIILTHEYVQTNGGQAGTISVLEDVANPPVLSNDQSLIATLFLPPNTSALDDAGVVYTQSDIPSFANGEIDANLQAQIDAINVEISNINIALGNKIDVAEKGVANGVATLGANALVPISQLPPEFVKADIITDIPTRDALVSNWTGRKVHVIDASGDASVEAGYAGYIWDGNVWLKIYQQSQIWTSLNFTNTGTANYVGLAQNIEYSKGIDGMVKFRGTIQWDSVDGGTREFQATLPNGFRYQGHTNTAFNGLGYMQFYESTKSKMKVRVPFQNNGTLTIEDSNMGTDDVAGDWLSLAHISYYGI